MLTIKDINNMQFEQTRPGYSPQEVDNFLKEITADITKYQRDRDEAEKKIQVLVESVRQYKDDEDALKDALIGAQKQGRAVINEAQLTANRILAEATAKAQSIVGNTQNQITKEKECLIRMQKEVSEFKSNLLAMYKAHLESITSIPDYDDDEEIEEQAEQKSEVTAEKAPAQDLQPEQTVQNAQPVEPSINFEKRSYPFSDENSRAENKFSDLKFGQNK